MYQARSIIPAAKRFVWPNDKPPFGARLNRRHPLAKGLVGACVMNEGAGNRVIDLSGSGNNGTITGADWCADGLDFVAANSDYILNTDGRLKFEGINDDFTIVTQINSNDISSSISTLLWIQDLNNDMWRMFINTDGRVWGSLDTIDVKSSSNLLPNTWYDLACVFNKSENGQIFINGVADGTPISLNNEVMSITTNNLYISSKLGTQYFLDGAMAYIYIYNRALSADEVAWLNREPYAMFQPAINPAMMYYETPSGLTILDYERAIGRGICRGVA